MTSSGTAMVPSRSTGCGQTFFGRRNPIVVMLLSLAIVVLTLLVIHGALLAGSHHVDRFEHLRLQVFLFAALLVAQFVFVHSILRQARATHRALGATQEFLDNARDAVLWSDQTGRIRYVNKSASALFRMSENELLERFVWDIDLTFTSETYPQRWANLTRVKSVRLESTYRDALGRVFDGELSVDLMSLNGVTYSCASIRDVTEKKSLLKGIIESESRYRALVEISPDAICLMDDKGMILMSNRKATELLGFDDPNDLVGMSGMALISPKDRDRLQRQIDAGLFETGQAELRLDVMRKDGVRIPIEIKMASIPFGKGHPKAILGVARDVSERERLEKEIVEIRDREQERIGQDLHDGVCSHLVGVSFMAEALAQRLDRSDSGEAQSAKEITELIREAVTQARSVSRGLSPVSKRPDGLAQALSALVRAITDRFNIPCIFEHGENVDVPDLTKSTHLYRIAQEAINNAMVHAQPKRVFVRLRMDAKEGRLEVEDDGVGIPATAGRGRGMGLTVMAHRARIIGGSLVVHQTPVGKGTLVTCLFPS